MWLRPEYDPKMLDTHITFHDDNGDDDRRREDRL